MTMLTAMRPTLFATTLRWALIAIPALVFASPPIAHAQEGLTIDGIAAGYLAPFQELGTDVETIVGDLSTVIAALEAVTRSNVEDKLAQVRGLGDRLTDLAVQLQPGGELHTGVDRLQSWIGAQAARLNSQRDLLGADFVADMLLRYEALEQEATAARGQVTAHAADVENALRALTTAERRAAELLLVATAEEAVAQLAAILTSIGTLLAEIRGQLAAIGTAGV